MKEKIWNSEKITDLIQKEAIRQRRPLSCILELTYRCNFSCRMCYIRMSDTQARPYGRMRTVEEWLDMAGQLRDAGVFYLTLTGGECTCYPGFETLYPRLIKMGFNITIMSNAGSYTDSIRELFRKYPPGKVAITLYGGSNQTYKNVTGDPEGFEKTVNNIRFLKSINVPVSLNFTIVRQNVSDYPLISKLSQDLGIPYTLITDLSGHHYDPSFSEALDCRLSPAERCYVACHTPDEAAHALEKAKELEKALDNFCMPESPDERLSPEPDACIGSYSSCAIYWNGDMHTCISMRSGKAVPPSKPFEIGFEAAWAQLQKEHDRIFCRPPVCQVCDMAEECLHNCPARRLEGTGFLHKPDPYTCQYVYLLKLCREKDRLEILPSAPDCN